MGREELYSIAELTHGSENITAKVLDENNSLGKLINKEPLVVELDYNRLVDIELINNFRDSDSVIFSNFSSIR